MLNSIYIFFIYIIYKYIYIYIYINIYIYICLYIIHVHNIYYYILYICVMEVNIKMVIVSQSGAEMQQSLVDLLVPWKTIDLQTAVSYCRVASRNVCVSVQRPVLPRVPRPAADGSVSSQVRSDAVLPHVSAKTPRQERATHQVIMPTHRARVCACV